MDKYIELNWFDKTAYMLNIALKQIEQLEEIFEGSFNEYALNSDYSLRYNTKIAHQNVYMNFGYLPYIKKIDKLISKNSLHEKAKKINMFINGLEKLWKR